MNVRTLTYVPINLYVTSMQIYVCTKQWLVHENSSLLCTSNYTEINDDPDDEPGWWNDKK